MYKAIHGIAPTYPYDRIVMNPYDYDTREADAVKPVYNDHLMGYFSAFWSSARWPRAT